MLPGVFAAWYGDDLAYTESLLVSPKILRKYFFPGMQELAGIAHAAGMPFIMHSDGRLWQVLDDLIALGVNALHPIEAKAMDIYDLKRRYGQKLAIFGNVDLGYALTEGTGTPEAIRAEVRQQIKELAPGGGCRCFPRPAGRLVWPLRASRPSIFGIEILFLVLFSFHGAASLQGTGKRL